jgi:hypothetical protein
LAWAPLRGILVVCVYRYASAPLAWAAQPTGSCGVSLPIDTRRTARLARSTASRGGCLARVPRSEAWDAGPVWQALPSLPGARPLEPPVPHLSRAV